MRLCGLGIGEMWADIPDAASGSRSRDRLVGLVGKASASRVVDPGSISAFPVGIFPRTVRPVT